MKIASIHTPPMASFRFWFSKSANNTQRPAQNHPLCRSSVIRGASSGFTKREAITKPHRTERIDSHEAESESDGGYDNRKRRYSALETDVIIVHNRPHDQSKCGTSRRKKSNVWSAATRQRTQIISETTSYPKACLICNALTHADLCIKDATVMSEKEDSDQFSDTAISVNFVAPSCQAVILTDSICFRTLDLLQDKH